jgi:hypothetical protein
MNEPKAGQSGAASIKENETESQKGEKNKTDETTRTLDDRHFRGDKIKDDKVA